MARNKHFRRILLLFILSYFFFVLGNGNLNLSNPDEVFYAQTAKEMGRHHTWLTPYLFGKPNFEKPVLTYWLLRIAFILFGISSFGARLFPALFACLGIISVYLLGLLGFKDEKKAFLSSLVLLSSGIYVGLARTVFTDLIFAVFILFSLTGFFWGYSIKERKAGGLLLFFVFSGFAVLTKGPLGLLIPFLTVTLFLFARGDMKFLFSVYSLWGIFAFAVISLPWYIFMFSKYGQSFINEFFYNDHIRRIIEAEHIGNDRWYFYPLSMLGCMFPWSAFVFASLISLPKRLLQDKGCFYIFLGCWIYVVFISFQFAHSKLASYIFPLFPALSLISAGFIYDGLSVTKTSRLIFLASLLSSTFLLLLPVSLYIGLGAGLLKYSAYIPSKILLLPFLAAFLALGTIMLALIFKNRLLKNIYCLTLVLPIFLYAVSFFRNYIEPYVSSKKAAEYLLKNYSINNTILCSKIFVRGVRYYTDKDVAVISIPGAQFFSPHPIPFLNTDQKVKDFLRRQQITYCILRKSSLEDIERIVNKDFNYNVLNIIGNEYIVRIEPCLKPA